MLTKLRIKNFKSWKDTRRIRLAPLTVFFGSNSSGKSSINQFLLMLKQTAQSPDRKRVLHLGDKSTAVDLGTYHDIIHSHSVEENITLRFYWDLLKKYKVEDILSKMVYETSTMGFAAEIGHPEEGMPDIIVQKMRYIFGNHQDNGFKIGLERKETGRKGYELITKNYSSVRNPGRVWPLPPPTRFYGFPDEVIAYYQNTGFLQDLTLELEKQLQRIYYLGPLRDFLQRSYTWSGEIPEDVGWHGNLWVNAILAAQERWINPGYRKKAIRFEEMIARWLKQFGLINEFKVKEIGKNRRDYEVLVKTAGVKETVNITDVGFGVSQVLPVLVQCFYVPENSTIIIEQPEIHLHPSVQASLADLFIETVQARENGKDRKIQLLIESHSEHFLRRLQRRVAEEKISSSDVAIYFCNPTSSGSKIEPLKMDEYGNIVNWPDNFFGDEMGDLTAMTEAMIQRKLKGK